MKALIVGNRPIVSFPTSKIDGCLNLLSCIACVKICANFAFLHLAMKSYCITERLNLSLFSYLALFFVGLRVLFI